MSKIKKHDICNNNNDLFNFIITNPHLQQMYDEAIKKIHSHTLTVNYIRKYLLSSHLRGNIDIKEIEQAYKSNEHDLLLQLLQERFLQVFTQEDYQFILQCFQFNKWSWQDVIEEFTNNQFVNILQIITCSNTKINN